MKLDLKKDYKLGRKKKMFLAVALLIAAVLSAWEYYCLTRPIEKCTLLCKEKSILLGTYNNGRELKGKVCTAPWYQWLGRDSF